MIKKLLRASAASQFAIALVLSLCSCAGTSESDTQSLVSNPFETSENLNSETQASNPFDTTASVTNISVDSAVIETLPPFSKPQESEPENDDFSKYQEAEIAFSDYSIEGKSTVKYSGGEVNFSFVSDSAKNKYDVEIGYMAFINGVPQKLSLNGSEKSELVSISQKPDTKQTVTLTFIPEITKEYEYEKILKVKLMTVLHPSYRPKDGFLGFGNAHSGQSFFEFEIEADTEPQIIDDFTYSSDCESILATAKVKEEYNLTDAKMSGTNMISLFDAKRQEHSLSIDKSSDKLGVTLLLYGGDPDEYAVYFYKNHERIKLGENGGMRFASKTGYINEYKVTLDDVKAGDIIYAVEVPLNAEVGSMNIRKSISIVVTENE